MNRCEVERNDGRVCGRQRNGRVCGTHYAREAAGTEMGAPIERRGGRRNDWPGEQLVAVVARTFEQWLTVEFESGTGSADYREWIARRARELAS